MTSNNDETEIETMNFNNEDEVLDLFSRLLERLQQADGNNTNGSNNTFVYVAPGAQYVKNLYQQTPMTDPPRRRGNEAAGKDANPPFDADTPLSALFRESHHEELRQIIESWRPFLIEDDPNIDALALNSFHFDFEQTRPVCIYMDFARLINHDALVPPISVLAAYLFQHSNLSRSENALYVQLKRYRKLCE